MTAVTQRLLTPHAGTGLDRHAWELSEPPLLDAGAHGVADALHAGAEAREGGGEEALGSGAALLHLADQRVRGGGPCARSQLAGLSAHEACMCGGPPDASHGGACIGAASSPALSLEYLFHSARTDADGSSLPGRCPNRLLKNAVEAIAADPHGSNHMAHCWSPTEVGTQVV